MRKNAAPLNRMRPAAMLNQGQRDTMRSIGECLIDIPISHIKLSINVVTAIQRRFWGTRLHRLLAARDRVQFLNIQVDQGHSIFGDGAAFSNHQGDRFPDIDHFFLSQDVRANIGGQPVAFELNRQPIRCQHRAQISECQHRNNAGNLCCERRIDAANATMGDGTAQKGRMRQAMGIKIINEFSCSPQQGIIFLTPDGLTNKARIHGDVPISGSGAGRPQQPGRHR